MKGEREGEGATEWGGGDNTGRVLDEGGYLNNLVAADGVVRAQKVSTWGNRQARTCEMGNQLAVCRAICCSVDEKGDGC